MHADNLPRSSLVLKARLTFFVELINWRRRSFFGWLNFWDNLREAVKISAVADAIDEPVELLVRRVRHLLVLTIDVADEMIRGGAQLGGKSEISESLNNLVQN